MHACIPNIGPRQQRRRLALGAAAAVASAALALILAFADASVVLRTAVAVPLYGAALGFFQYREKT
jgi:hypothetical protein